jgi:hypothetical protein
MQASPHELKHSMLLGHAVQVLESRLVEKMRFELGAIYNVSAASDFAASHAASGQDILGSACVSFTCQPHHVSMLADIVVRELDRSPATRMLSILGLF